VTSTILTLSDFEYNLPDGLIAQDPLKARQSSRLFVRHADESEDHKNFRNLADFIPQDSLVIVNNSKVFASRLVGKLQTGGKIEIFVLEKPKAEDLKSNQKSLVPALGRPFKKLKVGTEVYFEGGVTGVIRNRENDGISSQVEVEFSLPAEELLSWMNQFGYVPLPPYIQRKEAKTAGLSEDKNSYQTVYAQHEGSVAAPTAGLHFEDEVICELKRKNINIAPVTLHVGAGTFMPVKHQEIDQHTMHKELYQIPQKTAEEIVRAKTEGRKIIAVGTTSFRSIESALKLKDGDINSIVECADQWMETDLFVRPRNRSDRYKSRIIDGLITNFHQPGSTLFMLICSLIGYENALSHYQTAIDEKYRFLSYGDSNLFWL